MWALGSLKLLQGRAESRVLIARHRPYLLLGVLAQGPRRFPEIRALIWRGPQQSPMARIYIQKNLLCVAMSHTGARPHSDVVSTVMVASAMVP